MKQRSKGHKIDRETAVFMLFLCGMAVYYGWRLFGMTPWYDELYTYYYFISRGPLYAAIHWPLPNNHIGYSVLSACLGIFGNAAIALRGISFLSSLGSLVLVYRISRKCFDCGMALMPVFFFAGMKLVNQLAVQGRGYAFVTFCYLAAVCKLFHIVVEHRDRIRDYLVFGLCLTAALYAIPSSVYVVIPVCLAGGVLLLLKGEYRRLVRLVSASLAGAVCTLGLYGIVWLAIGSNLLTKEQNGAYYGLGHVAVILKAPFLAMKTGIDYMLATPYIQSVGREGFAGKFVRWLQNLLNEYYAGLAAVMAVLLVLCLICILTSIAGKIHNGSYRTPVMDRRKEAGDFLEIYLAAGILVIPLMLLIQCSLPYYRVFSFAGVLAAFGVSRLWQSSAGYLAGKIRKKKMAEDVEASSPGEMGKCTDRHGEERKKTFEEKAGLIGSAVFGILCIMMLASPAYRAQYSDREASAEDAYRQIDPPSAGKIGVTDCDQKYLLLFLYNIGEDRVTTDLSQADVVLADKFLLLGYGNEQEEVYWRGDEWKLYMTAEQFQESRVQEEMEQIYENDRFVLYGRAQDTDQ
ncbi:MAG: hypothetical protein HFI57_03700 [Lachnospiraceae bacterium]|nr:hypothetical protein [Lachnospiraceae bacterium]